MSKRKHGRSLLGLLVVAALGVMAFAASAQALTPKFLINKTAVPAGLNATYTAKQLGTGSLLIPGLNAEINCTAFTLTGGIILTGTVADGNFLFEGCSASSITPLEPLAGCEIVTVDTGSALKHITATRNIILPAELTNGEPALLLEKIETKILVREGLGCVLPKTTIIKGELCIKIDNNDTKELLLLASQAIQAECKERPTLEALTEGAGVKDKLLFGAQEAFVDFDVDLSLTGVHNGLTLGVSLQ